MIEFVAIVVGFVIAVGGWFATGVLNRRAVRRATRIEYLLSAYRRLDGASGRALDPRREADLESAVADIQLLGSTDQVELANEFVRAFASDRTAEAGPLLESLRQSLRRELLLDRAPPREIWLRIARDGDLWTREVSVVQARLREATLDGRTSVDFLEEAASRIDESYGRLDEVLRSMVPGSLDIGEDERLLDEALARGIISLGTAEAVRGLTVLRNLARAGAKRLTLGEVTEFGAMVDGVIFAVEREARLSQQSHGRAVTARHSARDDLGPAGSPDVDDSG